MGKKIVFVDDLDGTELDADVQPFRLGVGSKLYDLYLSDDNMGKLLDLLKPYTDAGEAVTGSVAKPAKTKNATKVKDGSDAERNKAVREWAQATGFTYETTTGETKTLGDRGKIPQPVFDAYDAEHADA